MRKYILWAIEISPNLYTHPTTVFIYAHNRRDALSFYRMNAHPWMHIQRIRRANRREIAAWPMTIQ